MPLINIMAILRKECPIILMIKNQRTSVFSRNRKTGNIYRIITFLSNRRVL